MESDDFTEHYIIKFLIINTNVTGEKSVSVCSERDKVLSAFKNHISRVKYILAAFDSSNKN